MPSYPGSPPGRALPEQADLTCPRGSNTEVPSHGSVRPVRVRRSHRGRGRKLPRVGSVLCPAQPGSGLWGKYADSSAVAVPGPNPSVADNVTAGACIERSIPRLFAARCGGCGPSGRSEALCQDAAFQGKRPCTLSPPRHPFDGSGVRATHAQCRPVIESVVVIGRGLDRGVMRPDGQGTGGGEDLVKSGRKLQHLLAGIDRAPGLAWRLPPVAMIGSPRSSGSSLAGNRTPLQAKTQAGGGYPISVALAAVRWCCHATVRTGPTSERWN